MAKQKFYVVWEGREKGIFTDWPRVQKSVSKHPKAKHKSFDTMADAELAFSKPASEVVLQRKKGVKKESKANFELDTSFDIHIFCDGGCDPNPGPAGSGVAVYRAGKLVELHYGLFEENGTNNTAELNALHQSMLIAAEKLNQGLKVQILADSTYAIKAMTDWGAGWKRRGWKRKDGELANRELIIKMYEVYESLKEVISIKHVKAHIGTEGNELADRLSMLTIKSRITAFLPYEGKETVNELLALQSG